MKHKYCSLHTLTALKSTGKCALCENNRDYVLDAIKEDGAKGVKFDANKCKWTLASTHALEAMVRVLMFGAKKYGERNWEKGLEYSRIIDAILRHTYAYLKGERIDPETGESHMAAVMTNAHFLLHFEQTGTGKDDLVVKSK